MLKTVIKLSVMETQKYDLEESKAFPSLFLYFWCREYGISKELGMKLGAQQIQTADDLNSLGKNDLAHRLGLTKAEVMTLKVPLVLYKKNRLMADDIIMEKCNAMDARIQAQQSSSLSNLFDELIVSESQKRYLEKLQSVVPVEPEVDTGASRGAVRSLSEKLLMLKNAQGTSAQSSRSLNSRQSAWSDPDVEGDPVDIQTLEVAPERTQEIEQDIRKPPIEKPAPERTLNFERGVDTSPTPNLGVKGNQDTEKDVANTSTPEPAPEGTPKHKKSKRKRKKHAIETD